MGGWTRRSEGTPIRTNGRTLVGSQGNFAGKKKGFRKVTCGGVKFQRKTHFSNLFGKKRAHAKKLRRTKILQFGDGGRPGFKRKGRDTQFKENKKDYTGVQNFDQKP